MNLLTPGRHRIERIRREAKRRMLTVASVTDLTPKMRRIVFASPELTDFLSLGADDHVKLFAPDPGSPQGFIGRDYTPRAFDPVRAELTIDFALHDAGPATAWALAAKVGDTLQIGGPRGSVVVTDDFDFYLLIGDETALPAIGRRVEELRAGVPVVTVAIVDGPEERQSFATRADWRPIWVYRDGSNEADLIKQALAKWSAPNGDGYVWIAAEAMIARALKDYVLNERGHAKAWFKASGYWVNGAPGETAKIED
jgi:NADPH-dependent ferric siderophore reductase